jgi:hypothetical protein
MTSMEERERCYSNILSRTPHETDYRLKLLKKTIFNILQTSLCLRYLGGSCSGTAGCTQGAEVMAGQCLGLRPPVPVQLCDVAGNALNTSMLENYLYASDVGLRAFLHLRSI